jgi:hypothetical protein
MLDSGVPRYLGSLILKVSANACGRFTIGFVEELSATFIADPANPPNQVLPASQPLLFTVSDCSRQLLSCNPDHCNHDARIAYDRLNFATKLNTNTIQMTFSKSTAGMTASDFDVTLFPSGGVLPVISTVTPAGNSATLVFNPPIRPKEWTCIRDKGSNKRCCLSSLPADADDNRISQLADTFEVYDNLQGGVIPALTIEKCDTDRSLLCSPADLLMVVDLLTGADAFVEVNGDSLEVCPGMRPPP